MTEVALFGPLYGSFDIEKSVVTILKNWISEYLNIIEVDRGFPKRSIPRPPTPESIHGGLDFERWEQDRGPEVIVVVEPLGEPEREASVGYIQTFEIQVGMQWIGVGSSLAEKPEDEARLVGSYYGVAMQLLVQQGELKIPTQEDSIVMVDAPRLTFPEPDLRQRIQVVTTFHCWLEVVNQNQGPTAPNPKESPYWKEPEGTWGEEPKVETTDVVVKGETI